MKKIFTLMLLSAMTTVGMLAQDTWTVVGSAEICNGKEWDKDATENDMTFDGEMNYTLVREGCVLEAGREYQYKVVKNHDYAQGEYPGSMQNKILKVNSTGTYTVTFSFNAVYMDLDADAQKTGEAVIGDKSWTVAGVPAALLGTEWDSANTDNDMEKQGDGTYKLEKKGVTLSIGSIQYKVCANHGWSEAYPSSNAVCPISEDGVYDVTFTFNPETKDVAVQPVKQGSAVIEKSYSLVGAFQVLDDNNEYVDNDEATTTLFGTKWDVASTSNDMWQDGDNYVFEKTSITLPVGQIACKVVANHSWDENYGADGVMDGSNVIATITQAGVYNVKFTFTPATKILTVVPTMTAAGISNVAADAILNDVRYNLAGQRVSDTYKGVVIMNGKKLATP
jgi:hypothetical protein